MKSLRTASAISILKLYAVAGLVALLVSSPVFAESGKLSFDPGFEPASSHCDGDVRFTSWIQNVEFDGDDSQLRFQVIEVSNPDIFARHPWVSWPSRSLNYRIAAGTPGGLSSEVTAILLNGTDIVEEATSQPRTWRIFTRSCEAPADSDVEDMPDTDSDGEIDIIDDDDDNDGISDVDEGDGVVDTDGDGAADSVDLDSDNDLIPDEDEHGDSDVDGIRDSEEPVGIDITTDSDSDGIHDGLDLDDDNDGIIDTQEGAGVVDTDSDGIVDSLDLDSDNDGRTDLLESGIDLIQLVFDASWVLENEVGSNGLVDLVETSPDSGFPINFPLDADGDGIPDFQDNFTQLQNDAEQSVASMDANRRVATGLSGSGCSLGSSRFDPVIFLSLLVAFAGTLIRRNRLHCSQGCRDALSPRRLLPHRLREKD